MLRVLHAFSRELAVFEFISSWSSNSAISLAKTDIRDRLARHIFAMGVRDFLRNKNFGVYVLCGLFVGSSCPFFRYSPLLPNKIFELTTQRFETTSGVFSKVTDTLELYRVKDIETRPSLSRLIGICLEEPKR